MMMTVKVPLDVRRKLGEWAAVNLTSMTAEITKSVRDHMQREQAAV